MAWGAQRRTAQAGFALRVLVILFLVVDGATQLLMPGSIATEMAATGWPAARASILGTIVLVTALLYAIPATAVLGAILVSGFVGGAIATHLRVDGLAAPEILVMIVLGVLAWGALWLSDRRVRALMPISS